MERDQQLIRATKEMEQYRKLFWILALICILTVDSFFR